MLEEIFVIHEADSEVDSEVVIIVLKIHNLFQYHIYIDR